MPGEAQPLFSNQAIVDANGNPTQYFIRWAQQRQVDISAGLTAAQAQQLIDDWAASRSIKTGTGLTGGGTLAADRTLSLADTAVEPGTYGDATHSVELTIDQQGRVTGATAVPISGGGGGGGGSIKPTLVQFAMLRNDGPIALAAAPTPGNIMVLVTAGWTQSLDGYVPAGFQKVGSYSPDQNNGTRCWARVVKTGDTGAYNLNASDNQSAVLYEFSGAVSVANLAGGYGATNGSAWEIDYLPSQYGSNNILLGALENDSTVQFALDAIAGVSVDFLTDTNSGNHSGGFFHVDQTEIPYPSVTGTITSGGYSSFNYGLFAVIGSSGATAAAGNTSNVPVSPINGGSV